MKVSVRASLTVLSIPLVFVLVAGCHKKQVKAPDAGQEMTTGIGVTKPTPSRPGSGGSTGTAPGDQSSQLLALRGEDIPIAEAPGLEFVDPTAEERLILREIYFDFDRSNIKPEFQPVLEGIASWLNGKPVKQLLIEGHCDERGTNEYNLALGERRALSVRRYLVGLGISPDRLHTISYGEEKPADPGHTEASWSKNRRAQFKVSAN